MQEIFKSFEWIIKDKMLELDQVIRAMQSEMGTFSVSPTMQAEFLPKEFERIKREVVEEQERYHSRGFKNTR